MSIQVDKLKADNQSLTREVQLLNEQLNSSARKSRGKVGAEDPLQMQMRREIDALKADRSKPMGAERPSSNQLYELERARKDKIMLQEEITKLRQIVYIYIYIYIRLKKMRHQGRNQEQIRKC